jgi:hypothetical protein
MLNTIQNSKNFVSVKYVMLSLCAIETQALEECVI